MLSKSNIVIILIVIFVVYLYNNEQKKVENMDNDTKVVQTNNADNQFIVDNMTTAKRVYIKENPQNPGKPFVKNLPYPAASSRSDICKTQFCATCNCWNPILMGMCEQKCGMNPCDCDKNGGC